MSISSLFNSPSFSQEYILTSFDSSLTVAISGSTTAFSEKPITVTTTDGGLPKYITLPAGKYLATMSCCLFVPADTVNATVVNYAQLQIVDDTAISVLYGASTTYNKTLAIVAANIPTATLYINETVMIELTAQTNLTLRLAYNITGNGCGTKDTPFGINPVITPVNQIIFRQFI